MVNKNNKFFLIFSLVTVILLINTGCKDFGVPEYNFIVTHGDNVSGLPAEGTYTYKELSSINYDYIFLNDDERSPGVFINESTVSAASTGTIVMYRDIEIYIGDVDVRGNWKLTVTDLDNGKVESNMTFLGDDLFSGTFSVNNGDEGTWTYLNNVITMNYAVEDDYKFIGSVSPKYLGGIVYSKEINIGTWAMINE